jgi:hypothetical protein
MTTLLFIITVAVGIIAGVVVLVCRYMLTHNVRHGSIFPSWFWRKLTGSK